MSLRPLTQSQFRFLHISALSHKFDFSAESSHNIGGPKNDPEARDSFSSSHGATSCDRYDGEGSLPQFEWEVLDSSSYHKQPQAMGSSHNRQFCHTPSQRFHEQHIHQTHDAAINYGDSVPRCKPHASSPNPPASMQYAPVGQPVNKFSNVRNPPGFASGDRSNYPMPNSDNCYFPQPHAVSSNNGFPQVHFPQTFCAPGHHFQSQDARVSGYPTRTPERVTHETGPNYRSRLLPEMGVSTQGRNGSYLGPPRADSTHYPSETTDRQHLRRSFSLKFDGSEASIHWDVFSSNFNNFLKVARITDFEECLLFLQNAVVGKAARYLNEVLRFENTNLQGILDKMKD